MGKCMVVPFSISYFLSTSIVATAKINTIEHIAHKQQTCLVTYNIDCTIDWEIFIFHCSCDPQNLNCSFV